MNKRAFVVVAVVAVLVIASAAAALIFLNKGTGGNETVGAISIVDDRGKTVNLTEAPKRIISLGSAFTEIIFDLDGKDRVVGVDTSSWWLVENQSMTGSIANLGGVSSLSVETVLAKDPDLVVIWNFNMYQTFITNMEKSNITVAAFYPKNITTILQTISVLGEGIGEKADAAAMVNDIQGRLDAVVAKTSTLTEEQKPTVYLELMSKGGQTVGNGTLSNDIINMAGGVNIFANGTSYWKASPESIIEKNPDIVVIENQSSKTNEQLKVLLGDGVTAVANDDIYRIDGTTLTTSPSFIDALEQMAKWFHPELFT